LTLNHDNYKAKNAVLVDLILLLDDNRALVIFLYHCQKVVL